MTISFKSSLLVSAMALAGITQIAVAQTSAEQHGQDVHAAEAAKGQYVATLASIGIQQPWSRALPPTAKNGAVFVNIDNQGLADQLISASANIAKTVELHDHIHENGLMKMVQVDSIEVPAGGSAELKPGSYHIMLIDLQQPLREGEHFPVTLQFRDAGSVDLQVEVRSMDAGTAAEHLHQH